MADYKETNVTGTQWQRCCAVHIQNTYGQTPQVTMQEEQLTAVNGQLFQKGASGLNITYDPTELIPLLNPLTGVATGASMSQGQIYAALWSLYMTKAAARDAGV